MIPDEDDCHIYSPESTDGGTDWLARAYVMGLIIAAAAVVALTLSYCSKAHAADDKLILFILKACLATDATQCIEPAYVTDFVNEERCWHTAPMFMPQIVLKLQAEHPEFLVKAFACVKIEKGQGV